MKLTAEYRGEAAFAQLCSKIEWETRALVIGLQRVGTVRASAVEFRTWGVARMIFITNKFNIFGVTGGLKCKIRL